MLNGHQAEKKVNKNIVKIRPTLFMFMLIRVSILDVVVVATAAVVVAVVTDP